MKADYHHSPTRLHTIRQSGQEAIQGTQLIIHGNPQGLEYTRRWVNGVPAAAGPRNAAPHQVGEIRRGFQRRPPAGFDNPPCDPTTVTLFAVHPKQVGQLPFAQAAKQSSGRFALLGIHPHVERARLLKAEATLRPVDLVGADAKVGQHAIDRRDAKFAEHLQQLIEVGVRERDRAALQARTGQGEHGRVSVKTDQSAGRPQPLGQELCVTAGAYGGIHDRLPRRRGQGVQHLGREHRPMTRLDTGCFTVH